MGSAAGALAGNLLSFDTTGIDFAMTALFVVLLIDHLSDARGASRQDACLGGAVAVLMLLLLGPEGFLLPTLLVTVLFMSVLSLLKKQTEGADND